MRAAIYDRTGRAHDVLSIVQLPAPTPAPGEVRVRVMWSGINPSDVKTRAGLRTKTLPFPRIVPHSDGSGVIDEVGMGVPRTRIGERVWTWNAAWKRPFGTAAEYVVLPESQAVPLPAGTDLTVGACLGIPALTAYHAITVDGGVKDKSVLVTGGAGAVGHYAIQFARLTGARQILSTVSSPEKAALAKSAGADVVLNYKTEDIGMRVQETTGGCGIDRIVDVDFAGNIEIDLRFLKTGGEIVVYGSNAEGIGVPFFPMVLKHARLRFFLVYNLGSDLREQAIGHLTDMLEKSCLTHNIAARLPLERIADAHELVEQGRIPGKVILAVTET